VTVDDLMDLLFEAALQDAIAGNSAMVICPKATAPEVGAVVDVEGDEQWDQERVLKLFRRRERLLLIGL